MTHERHSHDHLAHAALACVVAALDVIEMLPVPPAIVALCSALTSIVMHVAAHRRAEVR